MTGYLITQTSDAAKSSKRWAEGDEVTAAPIGYSSRERAERRLAELVPPGVDPAVYGGYAIEEVLGADAKAVILD